MANLRPILIDSTEFNLPIDTSLSNVLIDSSGWGGEVPLVDFYKSEIVDPPNPNPFARLTNVTA